MFEQVLHKFGINRKICDVYHDKTKLVPGTLDSVRSHKGVELILTLDSQNAGRQLFHIPSELKLIDDVLHISMFGKFVIEAKEALLIDVLRLSIFRDGVYVGWLPLNRQKAITNLELAKNCTLTIVPEQNIIYSMTTYTIQLESLSLGQ